MNCSSTHFARRDIKRICHFSRSQPVEAVDLGRKLASVLTPVAKLVFTKTPPAFLTNSNSKCRKFCFHLIIEHAFIPSFVNTKFCHHAAFFALTSTGRAVKAGSAQSSQLENLQLSGLLLKNIVLGAQLHPISSQIHY